MRKGKGEEEKNWKMVGEGKISQEVRATYGYVFVCKREKRKKKKEGESGRAGV